MFNIIKEMPWVFTIIAAIWFPVILIALIHLFKRKEIAIVTKIIWLIIGLIPVVGLLLYGFVQRKKNIVILTFLATLLTTLTIWYFVFYQPKITRRDVNKETAIATPVTTLLKEFQDNEAAANAKYTNKVVEISGVVEKVENDEASVVVYLHTGIEGTSVSGRLKNNQSVTENTTITLKGILTGYILGQIQLNEAVITNGATASVATTPQPIKDTAITNVAKTEGKEEKKTEVETIDKTLKSTNGQIKFISVTPVEEIEATNTQVVSSLNTNGTIQFAVLIKGFLFENELMQSHFNRTGYLDSDKFPTSEFTGIIQNINEINFSVNGKYTVTAIGKLTIKGITKNIQASGTLNIENKKAKLNSTIKVNAADYNIDNSEVAELIDVVIQCSYTLH